MPHPDRPEMNDTDRECMNQGYDRGNYAAAYETEDYEVAQAAINGANGFYRIAHFLGFFSSYGILEVGEAGDNRRLLRHYREMFPEYT